MANRGVYRVGLALALALVALPALGARKGPADAGPPDAGVPAEVGVSRTDAGFAVETGGPGDSGVAQPVFLAPTLQADSPATYPPQLAAERVTGTVHLELLVDEAGEVESATLVAGVHPLLDDAALHAAAGLRFNPATLDGQPVPVRMGFEYRFEAPAVVAEGTDGGTAPAPRPVTLKGLVREKGNRRPLPGAVLVSDAAPDQPVETDAEGRFEARWPSSAQRVRVTSPGHIPSTFLENLRPSETLEVVYGLEPLVINPYETVVRGDRERTEVSRVTLHEAELREIPGTMGDPFRVVMLLPGVGSMVSGVAYPVVRGSQPSSTGYYLDGIRVPILFHLFLGPAVLHPDFIDTIDFYPGTPPPKYGRLMGGAIDGRLSRPKDDRVHGSAYADLINAGLFVEYPFQSTGTNVSLAGRYSYTPWIIALAANAFQDPPPPGRKNDKIVLDFWDYQARVEQDLSGGKLRLFAFGSSDTFGTKAQDAFGSTALQTILFHRVDLRDRRRVGTGELETGLTWGLDRLAIVSQSQNDDEEFRIEQGTLAVRTAYEAPLTERLAVRAGADLDRRLARVTLRSEDDPLDDIDEEVSLDLPVAVGVFAGAWAELLWQPNERWSVVPGLRVDNYHLSGGINHAAIEPRLTARYKLREDLTLKAGAGLFHQAPTTLISIPVVDIAGLDQGLQEALQFSLGAEWKAPRNFDIGLDFYVNPMLRTVELTPFSDETLGDDDDDDGGDVVGPEGRGSGRVRAAQVETPELPNLASHGLAYGMEVLLRRPLGGNWFGWLSYSLQRSTRYTRFIRYNNSGDEIGVDAKNLPFVFDQTHILNLVVSYKFANNVTLGGVLHFNTGRPEAGLGEQTQREGIIRNMDGQGRIVEEPGWVPVDRDQVDRLPAFFRFDVRLAKAWAFETFALEAYLDMLNVTISKEVVGYDYRFGGYPNAPLEKKPIGIPVVLPILGMKGRY